VVFLLGSREKCAPHLSESPDVQSVQRYFNFINMQIWSEWTVCVVFLKKYGIAVKFVTSDDPSAFAAAIDENTKAIYVESIGNPKYNVSPISEIAKVYNYILL
jgi:hypothetical protein